MNLYLTADRIGIWTGGGIVTHHELVAFKQLGETKVISREELGECQDPWGWDEKALCLLEKEPDFKPKLTHVYSGTFSKTAEELKRRGSKLVWTIAAHDKEISKEEHEKYGGGFPYRHLTNESLWNHYIKGYRAADCIITPSQHSKDCVQKYGGCSRIELIPHGCNMPEKCVKPPSRFIVGYLGAIGFDKGLIYLLQAWKELNYKDDSMLVLAGKDSNSQFMNQMWRVYGGGNVTFAGWQRNISNFYNRISLYCQPSATEGFGLEILEAMAHGRAVIASRNTGGPDVLDQGYSLFEPRDSADLVRCLKEHRHFNLQHIGEANRALAYGYTWEQIQLAYIKLWKEFL